MNIDSAADIDAGEILTVQVLGAGILAQAIELLLVSSAAVTVVQEDARVVLLIGNEGRTSFGMAGTPVSAAAGSISSCSPAPRISTTGWSARRRSRCSSGRTSRSRHWFRG